MACETAILLLFEGITTNVLALVLADSAKTFCGPK